MLRVMTLNVNGIRASAKKGLFDWLHTEQFDIICLQETRCDANSLSPDFFPQGYHTYFFDADKKGYSGVAIFSKYKPLKVHKGLGWPEADSEARYLQLDFPNVHISSVYLPSGTSGDARQVVKYDFLDRFEATLKKMIKSQKPYILCGDWNIAHKEIDLKNWRANQKHSGFLPEERAWLDKVFDKIGFVDAFRILNQEPDQYTWWSQRGRAREKNVGWRIDYQIITPDLKDKLVSTSIYIKQNLSDHAPLIMDYKLDLP